MPRKTKATTDKIKVAERRLQAIALRRSGLNYRDIGRHLGVSRTQAYNDVMHALDELNKLTLEATKIHQTLELDRLDGLMAAIWEQAQEGSLAAVDRVLKIMDRRAKLLGLDTPTKIAPTTMDGDDLPGGAVVMPPIYNTVDEWVAAQQQNSKTAKGDRGLQ